MCRRTGAVALITTTRVGDHALAEQASRVRAEVPSLQHVLTSFADIPDGRAPMHVADVNDCVTICWTSGTEAAPKAVPRCHADWLVMALGTQWAARLGPADVLLSPFPMTNMAGISGMFLPWLMVGGVFVPHHPFDLTVFLQQIAENRATYTVAPPALLTMLLHREDLMSTVDVSSLRLVGSGSAPLTPWMVRSWAERYGIEVINFFGSNEGIALVSDPHDVPDPDHRATYFPYYASKVRWNNPVAARTAVKLADPTTGAAVTVAGQPGELLIAGPSVFAGYLNAKPGTELDRSCFDADGWFRTGDVFEIAGESDEFLRGMSIAPRTW
ncbi:ANL family adenylate-forming protein [Fodinicola feengrottensis]|uniref:ANL family adenylate-forming protein n=1 Tax=Fodinicola feengrottensis TaxID=435914 RepID=UPI0024430B4D|nr:fatty acid--CoA ligase family protein [Fodinicola feengrottensis]